MNQKQNPKPEFEAGDVVLVPGGAIVVIVEDGYYPEDELWEDSYELYIGFHLVTLDAFAQHDIEVGLPGCKSISHLDWVQEMSDEDENTIWVVTHEVAYVPVQYEHRHLVLLGKLSELLLERAELKRFEYVSSPEPRLTQEDCDARHLIKTGFSKAMEDALMDEFLPT